jgi:hypothetical protein
MNLAALADRPAVSRVLERVDLDFERKGVIFDHNRIVGRSRRRR